MLRGKFTGMRTKYSARSIFVAILFNYGDNYDHESIGSEIFPDGFGCIEPPGPSSGFGSIALTKKEQDGKIRIQSFKNRKNDDGESVTESALRASFESYFDAYFVVDRDNSCIRQVRKTEFLKSAFDDKEFTAVHLCEFEPDE